MTWEEYGNDCYQRGYEESREEFRFEMIKRCLDMGRTLEEISEFFGYNLEEI